MTTTASYFDRKTSTSIRPSLSHLQADPASPHTPQRTFSSTFSSPSLSYRAEEETLVFELGARHLSVGIAGDSFPRCRLGFGPEEARRAGDYRRWLPGYEDRVRKKRRDYTWGKDHELWQMDLRNTDLGLVEDKLERAVREAYTKYLLLDPKNRKLVLVLPSVMPHRLISSILSTLFNNFYNQSITLLSAPVMSTVTSGCRTALVVDLGWAETIITAIYEYREVYECRTSRAMRLVTKEMAQILQQYEGLDGEEMPKELKSIEKGGRETLKQEADSRYFESAEETTSRIAWCPLELQPPTPPPEASDITPTLEDLNLTTSKPHHPSPDRTTDPNPMISLPSPFKPGQTIYIPFNTLSAPVESALLATNTNPKFHDDHDQPLVQLMYNALLSLPNDIRALCVSRIVITGGGANIPGLKPRLLSDLKARLGEREGWDKVSGRAAEETRKMLAEKANNRHRLVGKRWAGAGGEERGESDKENRDAVGPGGKEDEEPERQSAAFAQQTSDPITEELEERKKKKLKDGGGETVKAEVRGIETLGAWAGGSLMAALKVKGVVEVERETFLRDGMAGARREGEVRAATQRMSIGRPAADAGWTLGTWA
ncbi:MAG: hypothetical protein LQ342_007406 [Letrouitia transgressa]|nr:MAG: hypothetical protein LQ342_007406 [Letrouitia transgressa]